MSDWYECHDIDVRDDDGNIIYTGPKFMRCVYPECNSLVTQGKIDESGTCYCGGRKMRAAVRVTEEERGEILTGKRPLNDWERILFKEDFDL